MLNRTAVTVDNNYLMYLFRSTIENFKEKDDVEERLDELDKFLIKKIYVSFDNSSNYQLREGLYRVYQKRA